MEGLAKKDIISGLRREILVLEGFRQSSCAGEQEDFGLNIMAPAFPFGILPTGAVHEFISPTSACAAAANGFVSGLLSTLMLNNGYCLWVSTRRSIFPVGMAHFGIPAQNIIFVDVRNDKDALWVMEQGLKCNTLSAVVAELDVLSFEQSQRLQLAVEQSGVTGFLHRKRLRQENTLACVSRWKIRPASSFVPDGLPGVGFPAWEIALEKIRNGKPGKWSLGWKDGRFIDLRPQLQKVSRTPRIEHYA